MAQVELGPMDDSEPDSRHEHVCYREQRGQRYPWLYDFDARPRDPRAARRGARRRRAATDRPHDAGPRPRRCARCRSSPACTDLRDRRASPPMSFTRASDEVADIRCARSLDRHQGRRAPTTWKASRASTHDPGVGGDAGPGRAGLAKGALSEAGGWSFDKEARPRRPLTALLDQPPPEEIRQRPRGADGRRRAAPADTADVASRRRSTPGVGWVGVIEARELEGRRSAGRRRSRRLPSSISVGLARRDREGYAAATRQDRGPRRTTRRSPERFARPLDHRRASRSSWWTASRTAHATDDRPGEGLGGSRRPRSCSEHVVGSAASYEPTARAGALPAGPGPG